jgi:hypothetical protein
MCPLARNSPPDLRDGAQEIETSGGYPEAARGICSVSGEVENRLKRACCPAPNCL